MPLASDIPITDERAEVTIPDFEKLDQTSLRLAQVKVSLSTATLNHNIGKRAVPLIAGIVIRSIGRAVLRFVIKKLKEKVKEEAKEIARSAALRLACEAWYKRARGVNNRRLPPCPCKKSQADGDDRYALENIIQDIWRRKVFKRTKATSCYRQSNVG